ncbi:MAG TPA: cyanophycin synthetase [Pedomonas sp.]|uniref:cyanophycin synthetase n=1 Tax=Pedomonas sp. TaxID=2976421 RepID=UPI002F418834
MTTLQMSQRSTMVSERIRVIETGVYTGPHIFGDLPMIRIMLDLGALEARPSNTLPGFNRTLLAMLPGLAEHGCSYGEPGGFARRMEEGTWLGHVAEHVALELQCRVGARTTRGKTRSVKGLPGVYNVMFQYEEARVGLLAGRIALKLINSLLPAEYQGIVGLGQITDADDGLADGPFDLETALKALQRLHDRTALGPTTQALVHEAERRDIPVLRLNEASLIQLGHGKHQRRIRASITGNTSFIGVDIAGDKDLTKKLLDDAGLPVPQGRLVTTLEEANEAARRIGFPVVTKPLDGNHGRGVTLGIMTAEQLAFGFDQARKHGRHIIVEQFWQGRDYRILVVNGQVVAVAERVPAQVVGDGKHTIRELIDIVNTDPRRGEGHEKVMTRIKIDDHVLDMVGRAGLTLESVPAAGIVVRLRATGNMSTGGTAIDRTDAIHPDNAAIAQRAAQIIGLDVAGIDFIAADIACSVHETDGGIVEVNAAPGFRMHLEPSEGRSRNVARPVMDMLFPRGTPARVPVFAVTGTNGKSTTVRMVAHILRKSGLKVGYTTTSGVYVNDELIGKWDASGPKSARMILRDPRVEAAVLETARGGILREGLAFDRCDVGAVLNVEADHLGLKGIDTIEDLAWVKSVVVETVHRGGFSILNADDPLTARMARRAGGRIVYFTIKSIDEAPDFVREHVRAGGLAVTREPGPNGGDIVIHEDRERLPLITAGAIPATLGGAAEFNIQNAMAAAAMTFANGVPMLVIRAALASFSTSFQQSPGRLNVYDGHGFRVILDYAHNPAGLKALGDVVKRLRPQYRRTIGMVNIPGDRRDQDMRDMGAIAASVFDEIVFREDPARRGRAPGEIVQLLREGALAAGFPPERIHCVLDEDPAADLCLGMAQSGDLVVLTPTDVEAMWRRMLAFRPGAGARVTETADSPLALRHG